MMDIEDGELQSGGDDDPASPVPAATTTSEYPEFPDDSDYVILDRPKPKYPGATTSLSVSEPLPVNISSASMTTVNPLTMNTPEEEHKLSQLSMQHQPEGVLPFQMDPNYGRKTFYNNLGVADLLESSDKDSSSSFSDSDDDNRFGKKSRMLHHPHQLMSTSSPIGSSMDVNSGCPAMFPSQMSVCSATTVNPTDPSSSGLSIFQAAASNFQKQRKPNTVWSSVIQEEQIANCFDKVKVQEPNFSNITVERGSETYSFQRPTRQPRQRRDSDSSDISSEGLSDNALHYLRDGMSYNDEETGESSEHSLPQSFTSRTSVKKRRRTNSKLKRKVLNKLRKMKAPELAQYMASKLTEEKVKLLCRAVEILGKDNCIHIFIKTLKIEKRGGLMVKNQERRRTPGGVFLYLIRGDRRFPKSQIDLIFRDERLFHDKFRRKRVAVSKSKRKAKLEAQKGQHELGERDSHMKTHDDSYSDDTAIPDREHDGTDTGQLGDDSTTDKDKDTTTEEFSGYGEMNCDGSES